MKIGSKKWCLSNGYGAGNFGIEVRSIPAGVLDVPPTPFHAISMSVGSPALVLAKRDGRVSKNVHMPLDVDIVPAGTPSYWEVEADTATDVLILNVSPAFVHAVAARSDLSHDHAEIVNRFQWHDPQIARLGLLLRDELKADGLGGSLYGESLVTAMIVQLLRHHAGVPRHIRSGTGKLSPAKLRRVIEYLQGHMEQNITLAEIADAAGLSPSQFRLLFKQSMGLAPHQYLIKVRVERARMLLLRGDLSIGQIATETGFADQSHLTRHMRRLLGVTPRMLQSQHCPDSYFHDDR